MRSLVRMGSRKRTAGAKVAAKLASVVVVVAAFATVGVLVWIFLHRKPPGPPPSEAPSVDVEVHVVNPEAEMPDTFDLHGVVEANRVVRVSAEVAGRIERIEREEGTACQAGDVLVWLNTELLQAEYDRAATQAAYDAKEYERVLALHRDGSATERQKDDARARMSVSEAGLASDRARLDRARIAAPVAGVLNQLLVEKGEYVQPGTPVAEIVDTETVKAAVEVPELDVPFLETGSAVQVFTELKGEEKNLTGTLTYISELADQETHASRIEITLDNRARLLRSGQIVRVRLTRQVLEDVVMIPLSAVIPLEEGKTVYVVEGDRARPRKVELGIIKGRKVQVLEGLQAGDRLIVAGHRFVGPGQTVNVVAEP